MALNFPTTGLYNGLTSTQNNGVTYTYQNGKWIGTGAVSSTISDHLHHGSFDLTLNTDGTVQFPNYKFPVADGTSDQTLKTNGSGILTWSADNNTGYGTLDNLTDVTITSPATGQILKYNGSQWVNGTDLTGTTYTLPAANATALGGVKVGSGLSINGDGVLSAPYAYTLPNANATTLGGIKVGSGLSIDNNGILSVSGGVNTGNFTFNGDNMVMPVTAKLNSGGVGVTNSAEFGTVVTKSGATVTHSEIYMGGGTAEARAITDSAGRSLMYLGTENVGAGKFAGIVARDPNNSGSQYSPGINEDGLPTIGPGSNSYSVAVGVMNDGFTLNGVFADETQTVVATGSHAWLFDNDGDLKVPQEIRNARSARAVWSDEVPRDIADLTDNSMLLGASGSTIDINIDGGGAYATYEGSLVRADGGFSSTRWGINSVIFDGGLGAAGTGYTNSLNGGGA